MVKFFPGNLPQLRMPVSFSCFRYGSKDCVVSECEYVFTYSVKGEEAHFELSSHSQWVAIGFSSDNKMVNLFLLIPRNRVTETSGE